MQRWSRFALFLAVFLGVTPTHAVDGVLEINQICAVETGCFPADMPGFPVTIANPGSYRLTSSLQVSDAALDAIEVAVTGSLQRVTLDLNGFQLVGPVLCTDIGSLVSCGSGTGRGIDAEFGLVQIENGYVKGFGAEGVIVGSRSWVERVSAEQNGGTGIKTSWDSTVIDSKAWANGGDAGIWVERASTVERSVSASNFKDGIVATDRVLVVNCAARDNGRVGINASGGSSVLSNSVSDNEATGISGTHTTVRGNNVRDSGTNGIQVSIYSIATENWVWQSGNEGISCGAGRCTISSNAVFNSTGNGISAWVDSTVSGNTVSKSGGDGILVGSGSTLIENTSADSGGDGIECGDGCTVANNTVRGNTGFGLRLGLSSGYLGNVITNNTAGTVTGGENATHNTCDGPNAPSCP